MKDYKATLNLPQTSFGMKADLARQEPQFLQDWAAMGLYARLREARRGRPTYILHDGPPYPTGDLHIGTGMNKILKDFVIRFYSMNNFDAPFIPGWDCHGLPIEHRVMTELKERASELTDAEIRGRCYQFAMKYVKANRQQFESLGCLGDWDAPYLTVNPGYEAGVIRVFQKLVEKGYIYRQLKPIHWCFSCETALAEAELEYRERSDDSIYVEFPLVPESSRRLTALKGIELDDSIPVSILIWTTTPWTLPGNQAVAVHPYFKYAVVDGEHPGGGRRSRLVMAEDTVPRVMEELGVSHFEVLGIVPGSKLKNIHYRHPWFEARCPVVQADYVNLQEGTGGVHIAPGHGQEDYLIGRKYDLEIVSPVDSRGNFTEAVAELAGKNVFDANQTIVKKLNEDGFLWKRQVVTHSYPHCWRCRQPVIFRATQQWFVSLVNRELRQQALKEAEAVNWIPEWGYNRIRRMLEQRPDWCISRQRKWGIPIPAFYCRKCDKPLLNRDGISQIIRLFEEKGADCWFQLPAEEFLPKNTVCPACGNTTFRKEKDIFDVWFESGSSHRSVLMDRPELRFPADLYLEGSDQHRGWFQLSLLLSTAAEDRSPFRSVLTHGFVVDEKGEKMSKSRGNFISVEKALTDFPADILRLWFSSVDYRREINMSIKLIERVSAAYRKIRNTFKHLLGNLFDFKPEVSALPFPELTEIDRWALLKVEGLRERVTRAYTDFDFHKVFHEMHNFCVLEMSSFYLDVLKDRLYTYPPDSRERRSAQTAIWEIAVILAKLLAPILCFTSEEVWKHLCRRKDLKKSIHLALWPPPHPEWKDDKLKQNWERLLALRSQALKALEVSRAAGEIGNSLLARVIIQVRAEEWGSLLEAYQAWLPMLLIVSQVDIMRIAAGSGPERGRETEIEGIWIQIERTSGRKCVRCWKYSSTVGEAIDHPRLCEECRKHLKQIG